MVRVHTSARVSSTARITITTRRGIPLLLLPFYLPFLLFRGMFVMVQGAARVAAGLGRLSADVERRTRRGAVLDAKTIARRRFLTLVTVLGSVSILACTAVYLLRPGPATASRTTAAAGTPIPLTQAAGQTIEVAAEQLVDPAPAPAGLVVPAGQRLIAVRYAFRNDGSGSSYSPDMLVDAHLLDADGRPVGQLARAGDTQAPVSITSHATGEATALFLVPVGVVAAGAEYAVDGVASTGTVGSWRF